jgi:hypothetical protein
MKTLNEILDTLASKYEDNEIGETMQVLMTQGMSHEEVMCKIEQITSLVMQGQDLATARSLVTRVPVTVEPQSKRSERGGVTWHGKKEERIQPPLGTKYAAMQDLEQVLSPINVWKDDERDETIYTPRIMGSRSGPVSSVLIRGDVLFQSRRYVNPIITRVNDL